MKMKQEHYNHLKTNIGAVLQKYNDRGQLVDQYQSGDIPRYRKSSDLQRRFCFDLLYGAGLTKFVCDELYSYLNDDHIYTALKSICPKLELSQ